MLNKKHNGDAETYDAHIPLQFTSRIVAVCIKCFNIKVLHFANLLFMYLVWFLH